MASDGRQDLDIKLMAAFMGNAHSKYREAFGVEPHGTIKQYAALIELCPQLPDGILQMEAAGIHSPEEFYARLHHVTEKVSSPSGEPAPTWPCTKCGKNHAQYEGCFAGPSVEESREKRLRQFCKFIKGWKPNEALSDELYAFEMAEAWLRQAGAASRGELQDAVSTVLGTYSECNCDKGFPPKFFVAVPRTAIERLKKALALPAAPKEGL